jgi:hypothetical protein
VFFQATKRSAITERIAGPTPILANYVSPRAMCQVSKSRPRRLAVLLLVGSVLFSVCSAADPPPTLLDPAAVSLLERALLGQLGMKERPRTKRFNVPQPLVDMYERLQRVDDDGLQVVDHDSAIGFWPEPFVVGECLCLLYECFACPAAVVAN